MKILIVDNHDSFVYNIVQIVRESSINGCIPEIVVWQNDGIDFNRLHEFDGIILSPGPGIPNEAGKLLNLISAVESKLPILGVCLGMQAIAEHFGAELEQLASPLHGHVTHLKIILNDDVIMNMPKTSVVGRYHSWVVRKDNLPQCLRITSLDEQDNIMSLSHAYLPIYGVQFHPESIMSNCGKIIIENFLNLIYKRRG
jgi:anthranilate synthase component 2